jgi:hypothetical protein
MNITVTINDQYGRQERFKCFALYKFPKARAAKGGATAKSQSKR